MLKHPIGNVFAISVAVLAASLAGCGGGGGSSAPSTASAQASAYAAAYFDVNVAQSPTASTPATQQIQPWAGASFTDNNPPSTPSAGTLGNAGWSGTLLFGTSAASHTVSASASASSYAFTAPVTASADPSGGEASGLGIQADTNLPGVLQLCQAAASGQGTNGNVSTDVLVTASATRLTSISQLPNLNLTNYQDCTTASSENGAMTLSYDAATQTATVLGPNATPITTLSSSVITSLLSGAGTTGGAPLTGPAAIPKSWTAYRYTTASGVTKYVIIVSYTENSTGLSYLALWGM